MHRSTRCAIAFVILFVLYQSAEGVGADLLHSFAAQATLMTLTVLAAWPLGRWMGFRGYDAYALEGRAWLPWLLGGLLLAALANLAAMALGTGLGVFAWRPGGHVDLSALAPKAMLLAAISTFVPSIAEDMLTRGFWWRASGIRWRAPAFVAVSATIYTLNHIYRLGNGPDEWLMLFCYGTAYASAMLRSGSLWPAVGLHWGWNLSNALFGGMLPLEVLDHPAARLLWALVNLAMAVIVLVLPLGSRPGKDAERKPA